MGLFLYIRDMKKLLLLSLLVLFGCSKDSESDNKLFFEKVNGKYFVYDYSKVNSSADYNAVMIFNRGAFMSSIAEGVNVRCRKSGGECIKSFGIESANSVSGISYFTFGSRAEGGTSTCNEDREYSFRAEITATNPMRITVNRVEQNDSSYYVEISSQEYEQFLERINCSYRF
jgi:hypothetical protein